MIIAIQCTSTSFNEQLKEKYPFAYQRYMDKINGDVPMDMWLGNHILCRINDNLTIVNMFADTKEQLAKCKSDVERYAKRLGQEVSYDLNCKVESELQTELVRFGDIMVTEEEKEKIEYQEVMIAESELGCDVPNVVQYRSCCVTGHRPKDLYGYDRKAYIPLKNTLMDVIRELIELGVDTFYNGMAQGADQIFFWAVHKIKEEYPNIKNICIMPFKGQELAWEVDTPFGQNDYKLMVKRADEVIILKDELSTTQEVIIALTERNTIMIKPVDIVIAVTNNSVYDIRNKIYKGKGGTADAIKKAIKLDKTIWEINPTSLEVVK